MLSIKEAVALGVAAAQGAVKDYIAKHGEPFYCGFAWVEVKVERTNSKQAKELLAAGFRKDYRPKMLVMWNPSGHPTQSMDVKEAGAQAMVNVLRANGIVAQVGTRAD